MHETCLAAARCPIWHPDGRAAERSGTPIEGGSGSGAEPVMGGEDAAGCGGDSVTHETCLEPVRCPIWPPGVAGAGSTSGTGPGFAPAAGECCGAGEPGELAGLDAFLASVLTASAEDKKRTLVIGAPAGLVDAGETEALLEMRSKFVQKVLQHVVLDSVGKRVKVVAEYIMPIPGWRTGRGGMGPQRVEVNFLHVEFEQAWHAEALLGLFEARSWGPTVGMDVEWAGGVHQVRLAMEGDAARVMTGSAGVDGGVELTRHPVWRAAVSGERHTGLALTRNDLVQEFGRLAVVRVMQKLRGWGVDATINFVAMRPVLARGCHVIRGAILVVEVVKAPWVLPTGVALKDGMPAARLEWQVAGPRRCAWDSPVPPVPQEPRVGGAGGGKGGAWGGAMGGFGKGAPWGKGKPGMPGKGKGGLGGEGGKGKGGFGGKGGKGAGGGIPDALLAEQCAWALFVGNMWGEAAERRDLLFRCWGMDACPRAVYFTIYRDEIAPCQMGHCKTARVHGGQPRPCSVARGARLGLVPPHLRADSGGKATGFGPLFGGRLRDGLGQPPCVKGGGQRGSRGHCAEATRRVDRWVNGGPPPGPGGGGGSGGQERGSAKSRLGPRPGAPRDGAGQGEGAGRGAVGEGEEEELLGSIEAIDGMVELGEPGLGALLEGADGGGAGRRRGREDEAGPSAEADGAEAGRLAKMMRSPPHGGDGDGLSEDETMSQD